ncbi:hypothetical protein [Aeromicrobium yanjiei]|uniref:Uncharacterized protein n=1 Tax=Aeromicrobium yanjiei TaxID=2662028 RepID=A0A5Q2MIZ2_9ACTN|nr:hypothetical protein [Aeromicrobium yanjiei]QGG39920.1 hypothetical protein GEV26_00200 [Aeromicrobium yanjiei]
MSTTQSSLYGTKLACFRFIAGRNTASDSRSDDLFRYSGSQQITCSVDHVYDYGDGLARLAIKGATPEEPTTRLEVYKLRGLSGIPVLEWAAKVDALRVNGEGGQTWQGFTFYAKRFYALTGDHGQDNRYLHMQQSSMAHTAKRMTPTPSAALIPASGAGLGSVETFRPRRSGQLSLTRGVGAGGVNDAWSALRHPEQQDQG